MAFSSLLKFAYVIAKKENNNQNNRQLRSKSSDQVAWCAVLHENTWILAPPRSCFRNRKHFYSLCGKSSRFDKVTSSGVLHKKHGLRFGARPSRLVCAGDKRLSRHRVSIDTLTRFAARVLKVERAWIWRSIHIPFAHQPNVLRKISICPYFVFASSTTKKKNYASLCGKNFFPVETGYVGKIKLRKSR